MPNYEDYSLAELEAHAKDIELQAERICELKNDLMGLLKGDPDVQKAIKEVLKKNDND